jgi:hypothetical protein
MNEVELSDAIANSLSWVFPNHREPSFVDYLSLTFSQDVGALPEYESLCLAEAEHGDVSGEIGGIIKRWWLTDPNGCRSVPFRELPRFTDEFNAAEGTEQVFYRFPLIKFFRENTRITFGEAFGPRLACRKIGRLQESSSRVAIVEVRLVWNVKSIGGALLRQPMSSELDINEGRTRGTTRST